MDLVVLIDGQGLLVAGTSPLLKRRDAAVVTEANSLLAAARESEVRGREDAQACVAQARRQGYDEGVAQAQIEMAHRLAAALAARQLTLQTLAPTLSDIVVDTVALLVRNAPRQALILSALDSVDGLLKRARWAQLRVHPAQFDEARAALTVAGAEMVTVVGDADIEPDGCIFETDAGIADASLSVQLEAVRAAVTFAIATAACDAAPRTPPMEHAQ